MMGGWIMGGNKGASSRESDALAGVAKKRSRATII
jgi:hypothetical protein